jgi:hypothetical protein
MSKKIILFTIFLAATVFISGCVTDKENNGNKSETIKSDLIPTINLPSGFTFMAIHETDVSIGNSSIKAKEGIYRTDQGEDIYVQVFETGSPEELLNEYKGDVLNEYKSQYKDAGYDPFTPISFNGHKATKVMFYSLSNGTSVPKYNIVWTNKDSMIKVGPSIDDKKVINLATATNN